MPRIDPLKLLTCLKVLLASNGGIRSANEVKRLAGLMAKYSKKLVSKCIYIQILKCTNTELLGQFMGAGGWSLTHMWLNDGIRAMNWPLVQEILELLLLCPVDVQRLRSNSAPKLVKGLCKDGGNEGVRILATKLVEQWLKVVKGETMGGNEGIPTLSTTGGTTMTTTTSTTLANANTEMSDNKAITTPKEQSNQNNNYKNSILMGSENSSAANRNCAEEDPLAIPQTIGSMEIDQMNGAVLPNNGTKSSLAAGNVSASSKNNDSALIYKIVLKDGKQILAKIENSSPSGTVADNNKLEKSNSVGNENKDIDEKTDEDSNKTSSDKVSNKENEKQIKQKNSENKDNISTTDSKESKESSKDKSRSGSSSSSSRHRDHKSSSSHRSSSSSSKSKSSSSSKSKSSSSHRNSTESSSSRSRDKDNSSSSSSRDKDRDSDKHRSSKSSSSSSKDKHRDKDRKDSGKDKEKDKEKEKIAQAEKDKDTLTKVTPPSLDKIGKIPKKQKDDSSPVTSITIPSKKASMSIEIRKDAENRPKTVKTYNSQFRSHGLLEEAPPPPSRKGLKKPPPQTLPGTSIPSLTGLNLKRSSPPPSSSPQSSSSGKESSQPVEKKLKIDLTSTSNVVEKAGAIKLIPPKPKPSTLVESDMFMDALSASAHPKKDSKKRKRRPSASKEPGKDGGTSPPESPVTTNPTSSSKVVAPLKFYQDTLEDKDEERTIEGVDENKDDERKEDEDDIPLKRVKEEIEEKVRQEKEEEERLIRENEEPEEPVKKPPGPGCGPDGPPGVLMLHRRKGPKKKLTWRPQEDLEEVRFFELDETERVNVTKTFTDMKQMERFNEREAFVMARKLNCEDIMCEQTPWMPLIMVDEVPPHPEGSQSKEKKIQMEREQTTLKALYFTRHMIPDSPSEPDMEQYQITEASVIPLDDITGNPDAVNDFTSMPWPDAKGSPPHKSDDFTQQDMSFSGGPYNPFMPYNQNVWQMGPNSGPPPNGMPPNPMMNSMGGFNNLNMPPQNMPPSLLSFPPPDDMQMKINMMPPPFAGGPGGPNFNGQPMNNNNNGGPGFNNFGGQPVLNMNPGMKMNMNNMNNMNNNGPRGGGGGGMGRGGWRSGSAGPPNTNNPGGGNWRPQGPGNTGGGVGGGNGPRGAWMHGNNNRICKQFQRGYCRNGNKCSYVHPTNNSF